METNITLFESYYFISGSFASVLDYTIKLNNSLNYNGGHHMGTIKSQSWASFFPSHRLELQITLTERERERMSKRERLKTMLMIPNPKP
jgi:hypothetical protein